MKHIIKISAIILFGILGGCSKSYLDTVPTAEVSSETVFETTDNVKLAVNGLAKLMTRQYLSSQGFNGEGTIKMYYGNYPGGDFTVNLPGWSNVINGDYHDNSSTTYDYYPWYYYYKIISNANAIVLNVDGASGTDEEKAFLKAQALTYRAYCYSMLIQLYGKRWSQSANGASEGVVLRLDESIGSLSLSTMGEVYAQIYKDLDEAIELYQSSGLKREANYAPDINVAYAVYARAALVRQDYESAGKYAQKAREGYDLMSVADYRAGFNEPNSEWIWSCYGALDETLYFYSYFAYIAYNSSASAVRSYPKCISRELFNQIPDTDIRKGLFLDPTGYGYTTSTGLAKSDLTAHAFELYPDIYSTSKIYAYMQFKIKASDQPGVGYLNNFRSSEMYLIEAEADYFLNKPASDVQDLLVELNKTSGRDPAYTCTKTGADLLNEIKRYRKIELWGEGFDWFDYKRWGDTIERNTYDDGGSFIASLAVTVKPDDANKWQWVIPNKESFYNDSL